MKRWINTLALVAAFGLVFGTGCSKKDDAATGEATEGAAAEGAAEAPAAADMPAFVDLIPSDSPYVLAGIKPMPKAVADKMFDALEPAMAQLQGELKTELERLNTAGATTDDDKLAKAILEELDGKLNAKGLESLGISTTPTFALYGVGLMPVIRVGLKDPAALKQAIGRIEGKAGVKAPVLKSGDTEYYGKVEDGLHMVIAIQGEELVFGLTPDSMAATTVPMILGTGKPEKSIKAAGKLSDLMKLHGYAGYGVGFVDNVAITETLLGDAAGLNGQVFAEMKKSGADMPSIEAACGEGAAPDCVSVCKTEIKGLAAIAPRFVFGSKNVTDKQWVTHFLVETRADIAKDLSALAAPVPGLGIGGGDSLVSFGIGVDIGKTIEFAKAKVAAVKASPYKCDLLSGLNEGVTEMEAGLQQQLPPVVMNVRGVFVDVKSADTSTMPPKDVKGHVVVAASNPNELFTMAKGMVPPLAAVELKPDGKPVALPAAELGVPPFIGPVHAAMNDKALAISIGAGQEAKLGDALGAKSPSPAPLFSFGYDVGAFMKAVSAQTQEMLAGMPEEFRKEQEAQMQATLSMAKVFGVVLSNMTLSDKGLVIEQTLNLK